MNKIIEKFIKIIFVFSLAFSGLVLNGCSDSIDSRSNINVLNRRKLVVVHGSFGYSGTVPSGLVGNGDASRTLMPSVAGNDSFYEVKATPADGSEEMTGTVTKEVSGYSYSIALYTGVNYTITVSGYTNAEKTLKILEGSVTDIIATTNENISVPSISVKPDMSTGGKGAYAFSIKNDTDQSLAVEVDSKQFEISENSEKKIIIGMEADGTFTYDCGSKIIIVKVSNSYGSCRIYETVNVFNGLVSDYSTSSEASAGVFVITKAKLEANVSSTFYIDGISGTAEGTGVFIAPSNSIRRAMEVAKEKGIRNPVFLIKAGSEITENESLLFDSDEFGFTKIEISSYGSGAKPKVSKNFSDNSLIVVSKENTSLIVDGINFDGKNIKCVNETSNKELDKYGSLIHMGNKTSAIIMNSRFENASAQYGGALYFGQDMVDCAINDCEFEKNEAVSLKGGSICAMSPITITCATFKNNKVHTTSDTLTGTEGGGACYFDQNATLTDCVFSECSSVNVFGGVLYFDKNAKSINLHGCSFSNCGADGNKSGKNHGALIYCYNNVDADFTMKKSGNSSCFVDSCYTNCSSSNYLFYSEGLKNLSISDLDYKNSSCGLANIKSLNPANIFSVKVNLCDGVPEIFKIDSPKVLLKSLNVQACSMSSLFAGNGNSIYMEDSDIEANEVDSVLLSEAYVYITDSIICNNYADRIVPTSIKILGISGSCDFSYVSGGETIYQFIKMENLSTTPDTNPYITTSFTGFDGSLMSGVDATTVPVECNQYGTSYYLLQLSSITTSTDSDKFVLKDEFWKVGSDGKLKLNENAQTTFYVDQTSGDDETGIGKIDKPYKTIKKALSRMTSASVDYTVCLLSDISVADGVTAPFFDSDTAGFNAFKKVILKGCDTSGNDVMRTIDGAQSGTTSYLISFHNVSSTKTAVLCFYNLKLTGGKKSSARGSVVNCYGINHIEFHDCVIGEETATALPESTAACVNASSQCPIIYSTSGSGSADIYENVIFKGNFSTSGLIPGNAKLTNITVEYNYSTTSVASIAKGTQILNGKIIVRNNKTSVVTFKGGPDIHTSYSDRYYIIESLDPDSEMYFSSENVPSASEKIKIAKWDSYNPAEDADKLKNCFKSKDGYSFTIDENNVVWMGLASTQGNGGISSILDNKLHFSYEDSSLVVEKDFQKNTDSSVKVYALLNDSKVKATNWTVNITNYGDDTGFAENHAAETENLELTIPSAWPVGLYQINISANYAGIYYSESLKLHIKE